MSSRIGTVKPYSHKNLVAGTRQNLAVFKITLIDSTENLLG
jgi:hypothetical protein